MPYEIMELGHRGDGVAPGPIYVAQSLPGELVDGEIEAGRIASPRILRPSDQRVSAPCRHFKRCGGCSVQHASDAFVAAWKRDSVAQALRAQEVQADLGEVLTSPAQSRRRAVFTARRTKKGGMLGFLGRASDTLIEVPDCTLIAPELTAAMPCLEQIGALAATRKGTVRLTVTVMQGGLDVAVEQAKPMTSALLADLASLRADGPVQRLHWNGELALQETEPRVDFDGIAVCPPPGSFLQATKAGEAALIAAAVAGIEGAERVIDLFAGCGTLSLPMSRHAHVHAVEGEAPMLDALEQGWRRASGLKRVTTERRDLFRDPVQSGDLARFDAIVLDPPRAGAAAQVAQIPDSGVERLTYISCNPVSFARDARVLTTAGYAIGQVQVIDQFRWSPHVELAAQFSKT